MNLEHKLSGRIFLTDIHEILRYVHGDDRRKQTLFDFIVNREDRVAYHAAWVMSHFTVNENEWLFAKQNQLIDLAMTCQHDGLRRQLLTILYKQPLADSERADFLDFCFAGMASPKEPLANQSLCIKIAYELCRCIPELLDELKIVLDMIGGNEQAPAVRAARRNVLNAMNKRKSKP